MKKQTQYLLPGTEFNLRGVRVVIKRRANNSRGMITGYDNKIIPSELGWVDTKGNVWYESEFKDFIDRDFFGQGLLKDYKQGVIKTYNRVKLKLGS